MSHDPSQLAALWRALVEAIDDGLVVLDAGGNVVYANQAVADLLDYDRSDLLALDQADLLALCQPHRLDIERLTTVLAQDLLGPRPIGAYRVVTQRRRLLISPFALDLPQGRFRCLLVEDDAGWRSDLIADAVMRDMRSPLNFAISYSNVLINRIQSPDRLPEELVEFGKIIRGGVARALEQWESLHDLYQTDPRHGEGVWGEPVSLVGALEAAITELRDTSRIPLPAIDVTLAPDLPPVHAQVRHLHTVLVHLLRETTSRLAEDGSLMVSAAQKGSAVQVDLTLGGSAGHMLVRAYLFDALPLSTVEQMIVVQGGRLWIDSEPGQPVTFSFTLPIWQEQ